MKQQLRVVSQQFMTWLHTSPYSHVQTTQEGVHRLFTLGTRTVIYPELEGALQLLDQLLVCLGYSEQEVQQYTQTVRADHYDLSISTQAEQEALAQLETERS